jgi:hypothetical protein
MPNGHNIPALEKKVTALSKALANLDSAEDFRELIRILRRPGWTTPAEFIFASGIVDSMTTHVKALEQMKGALLKGSGKVALR